MNDLTSILREVVEADQVQAALICRRDGLLMGGYACEQTDMDAVGALVSRSMDHHEALLKEVAGGCLRWTLTECERCFVFVQDLEREAVLSLVLSNEEDGKGMKDNLEVLLPLAESLKERVWEALKPKEKPDFMIGVSDG